MKKRILSLLLSCLLILSIAIPLLTLPAEAAYDWSAHITDSYSKCLTKAGRSSFNGYCATYVNWQLVVLGINKSYVSGNGNKEFDNYKNKTTTTGGYSVKAYPASSYTVSSALNAITENGTKNAYNILLGITALVTADNKSGIYLGQTLRVRIYFAAEDDIRYEVVLIDRHRVEVVGA